MTSKPVRPISPKPGFCVRRALVLSAVALAGAYAAILLLLRLAGIPYNVRELFAPNYLHVRVAVFCVMLLWTCVAPAWIADFIVVVRRPRQWMALPLWAAGVSLVSWFFLKFSVTRESLWDILGSPVWKWPGDLELMYRFLALYGQFILTALAIGVTVAGISLRGWSKGLRRGAAALLWSLPWLILAWMVVIKWASTDNLTELIRSRPFTCVGPLALALLAAMIIANAAALGRTLAGAAPARRIVAFIATLLLVVPGWGLLQMGLEPAVTKYGMTFPAARFLLGASRQADLSSLDLLLRWSVVQLAVVAALTWGQLIAMSLSPAPGRRS